MKNFIILFVINISLSPFALSVSEKNKIKSIEYSDQTIERMTLFLYSEYSENELVEITQKAQSIISENISNYFDPSIRYYGCPNGTVPKMKNNSSLEIYLFKEKDKNRFYREFLRMPKSAIDTTLARVQGIPIYIKTANKFIRNANNEKREIKPFEKFLITFIYGPSYGISFGDESVMRGYFKQPFRNTTKVVREIDENGYFIGPFANINYGNFEEDQTFKRYPILINTSDNLALEHSIGDFPVSYIFACK